MFNKEILYNEIFHDVLYSKNKIDEKLYLPISDSIEISTIKFGSEKTYFSHSFRKLAFLKQTGKGFIIGQTYKDEGEYFPGYFDPTISDGEQAHLKINKRYTFWKVVIAMNKIVLVPKDSEIFIIDNH